MLRYRLVIPVMRSRHTPEYTARGVMVGTGIAMTPVVGIQMGIVFIVWLCARGLFGWRFSLIHGLIWTWISNVFTLLPLYYLFFVTGQVMFGRFEDLTGSAHFIEIWTRTFTADAGFAETLETWLRLLAIDWGLSMLVGSIPWAILSGWLAYIWSLALIRHRRARQQV